MENDNYFYETLKQISDKVSQIETVQKTDIIQLKASVGSLTRYIADTQETVNFSEIQSQLDSLSYKIESCNNVVAKDLSSDINSLKNTIRNIENGLQYVQSGQRESLKTVDFDDFRKQQINLTVKNNESLLAYIKNIKTSFENIASHMAGLQNKQKEALTGEEFEKSQRRTEENSNKANETILRELDYIKTAAENIKNYQKYMVTEDNYLSVKNDLNEVKSAIDGIKNQNLSSFGKDELRSLQDELRSVKEALNYVKLKQDSNFTSSDASMFSKELSDVKLAVSGIQKLQDEIYSKNDNSAVKEEFDYVKNVINEIKADQNSLSVKQDFSALLYDVAEIKAALADIQNINDAVSNNDGLVELKNELSSIRTVLNEITEKQNSSAYFDKLSEIKAVVEDLKANPSISKDDLFELKASIEGLKGSQNALYSEEILSEIKASINDLRENQNPGIAPEAFSEITEAINALKENQNSGLSQDDLNSIKSDFGAVRTDLSGIISELDSVKNAAYSVKSGNDEIASGIKNKLEELHFNLKDCIEQLTGKIGSSPSIAEIGAVVSDINGLQRDDIKHTAVKLQELQNTLSAFESDFRNSDINSQLVKINDIYSSMNKINDWIDKVGYINQSLENVYARFGENADFDDISDKIDIIYENMSLMNSRMMQLDGISSLTSDLNEKLPDFDSVKTASSEALAVVTAIKDKVGEIFASEPDMEDITNKIDIIYENLFLLNEKTAKVDEINSLVCDIKNKTIALEAYKNDSGNILSTVTDIKTKLDSAFAHQDDIEEVVNKIDILYDNISVLNEREAKTDEISAAVADIKSDLSQIDTDNIIQKLNDITFVAGGLAKSEATQNIYEELALIANKLDKTATLDDAENLFEKLGELSNKADIITSEMLDGGFVDKINELSEKMNQLNNSVDDELIFSKIDLIYENIGLLNTWVSKIDDLSEKNEIINRRFNSKMEEIGEQIEKLSKSVPEMKENLDLISGELNTITTKTKDETESYIYTLLDIESDFLKLHKSLDENKKETGAEIKELKESFSEITQDISSISVRTNKLILSADDANKEFEKCLTEFKDALKEFETQNRTINPAEKFNTLQSKLANIFAVLKQNMTATNNLNNAFTYLGDWADKAGDVIKSSADEISEIKDAVKNLSAVQNAISEMTEKTKSVSGISDAVKIMLKQNQLCLNETANIKQTVAGLSEVINNGAQSNSEDIKALLKNTQEKLALLEDGFSAFKNDDVSEIKSLMTGVTVQLGTSLRPDIDTLNSKIEQISEAEETKFNGFETLIQEKIAKQEKQIGALEEKVDALTAKIDKLADALGESSQDNQIKDVLNYIASQLAATNENSALIKDVAEKVSSFDDGINKIVSYIEE